MEQFEAQKLYDLLDKKEVLVFDMDGTMANSEPLHFLSHREMLKKYGATLTQEEYIKNHMGKPDDKHKVDFEKLFNIKLTPDHFEKRFDKYVDLIFKLDLAPFPYLKPLLEKYKDKQLVVLSASSKELIEKCLQKWDIRGYFCKIISVIDDKISKKEVFSRAEEFFNCKKDKVAVFEDSASTINFCNKEKICTILIEHNFNKVKHIKSTFKISEEDDVLGFEY